MKKTILNQKFFQKREISEVPELPLLEVPADTGLNAAQVDERINAGLANTPLEPATKTILQIVLSNLFTYFNVIFFILAGCIIAVGSWQNLMFMAVVLCNIAIGIVQELRSKKTLDELTLLNSPKGVVVREGALRTIDTADMVRDDIVIFAAGTQIFADAVVVEGECLANEALITGESDEIKKTAGDELLSGSFLISGSVRARLTSVGADSYAAKLTLEAKKQKGSGESEMMRSLSRLVKWIGLILLPFGLALGFKEIMILSRPIPEGVTSTVGALTGMIPEGLYLLTSLALAAGVLRLAQKNTLVHNLNCIETLARVDVLCVDKTGTITETKMIVEDIAMLDEERFAIDDVRMIMSDYASAMGDENETMEAIGRYFTGELYQTATETLPFSSARKYGGVAFHEDEVYLLGAPDILLAGNYEEYRERVEFYSARGCRVLLLGMYDGSLEDEKVTGELYPIALILLGNKVREEAPATFEYFAQQGVRVKVISGDNPITASEAARRAGIPDAELYIDARELTDEGALAQAAERYVVFGRVTPEQKRALIRAMKAAGHTVAMTGDGVNDVLALKEADCSVAMASGSDVAAQSSHIVLLDSNFASMPSVVMEGRRVINNIERSASLFLVKNIFSFLLALISLFASLPYPVTPAQLSLVSNLTIGIPSFILALEPNENLVSGRFMSNVIYRALPAALTNLFLVLGVLLFHMAFGMDDAEMSTICAIILAIVGLIMLHDTCKPYNKLRKLMMGAISAAFVLSVAFLRNLFTLSTLHFDSTLVLVVFTLLAYPAMRVITSALERLTELWKDRKELLKIFK